MKPATRASIMGARAVRMDRKGNTYICQREGNGVPKSMPTASCLLLPVPVSGATAATAVQPGRHLGGAQGHPARPSG